MLSFWFHTFHLYIKFYLKYSQQLNILTAEIIDFIVARMFGVQKSCNFLSNNEFRVVSALLVISTATSTPPPPRWDQQLHSWTALGKQAFPTWQLRLSSGIKVLLQLPSCPMYVSTVSRSRALKRTLCIWTFKATLFRWIDFITITSLGQNLPDSSKHSQRTGASKHWCVPTVRENH